MTGNEPEAGGVVPASETTAPAAPAMEGVLGPIEGQESGPWPDEDTPAAAPASRRWPFLWPSGQTVSGYGWIAYAIAAAVVVLDQLSKFWVTALLDLEYRPPIQVTSFFRLTMVHNQGVSFGLFKAHADTMRWVLVAFSVLVVALLVGWARKVERRLTAVALGLIIGGAIGNNWIDRVRFGWVVDFLDFSGLHFPWVFNVADSAISVGVALLLLDSVLRPDTQRQPQN
jgi:signal peptidase II